MQCIHSCIIYNLVVLHMIDNAQDSLDLTDWIWANSLTGGLLRNNMHVVSSQFNYNLLTENLTQCLTSSLVTVSCI